MASKLNIDNFIVSGNLIDIHQNKIYPASIVVSHKRIVNIIKEKKKYKNYLLPGFVDSHIHIESSMLPPSEFARQAVVHGTVATVSDPHEIANVLGVKGVEYMIKDGHQVPFKFYFGAPSCVPATSFETAGATLGVKETELLLKKDQIKFLSEMMNYPGVLNGDREVLTKIKLAHKYRKPIDGHAPGLSGQLLKKYISYGITTDHETYQMNEALQKIKYGMKIIIRNGSAAKNFDELIPLIEKFPALCLFCCDDQHPDDLLKGHINLLVKKAIQNNYDLISVIMAATINPVIHYRLDVGLLRKGDWADFIIVDNLNNFSVLTTYINGQKVAQKGKSLIKRIKPCLINRFNIGIKKESDFAYPKIVKSIHLIQVKDCQLITKKSKATPKISRGRIIADTKRDILKITVINRYRNTKPAVAFIKNFGLKKGALAGSVAHDSHNIIAVGVSDTDLTAAVNAVIINKGGLAVAVNGEISVLPLPIAGLMSDQSSETVAGKYEQLSDLIRKLGSQLTSPFMTLSFMALLVIPHLKLSDKGLFDGDKFKII